MNAINFIKQNCVDKAREVLKNAHWENIAYSNGNYYSSSCGENDVNLKDLLHVTESLKVIEKLGGIEAAKSYVPDRYKYERLKQAIADYEAIYSIPQSVKKAILNLEMHL